MNLRNRKLTSTNNHSIRMGQAVRGRVTDILTDGELILAIEGDLLRVQNETKRRLKIGDTVTLLIKAVNPLRFQLLPERAGHIDLVI